MRGGMSEGLRGRMGEGERRYVRGVERKDGGG